ncbi:uncharacterized protein LOC124350810 [Daphnia pulicaria]|uniref:uncharacterized protein LOC124350810 n=1 Tax=Daphnia pulicaria TaxID=35523 RepID=UPI001EEA4AB6|nr:uncharacterized protein LOC124350810 [Daphnia pulicaria]
MNSQCSKFLLLLFSAVLMTESKSREIYISCAENRPCKAGEYCMESYCERCIPCESLYHRQSSSTNGEASCARNSTECGPCLPGYQNHSTTDGSPSRDCFPLIQIAVSTSSIDWKWIVVFLWLSIISIGLVARKFDLRKCCTRVGSVLVVNKESESFTNRAVVQSDDTDFQD